MSVEVQILLGFAALYAAVYLAVLAVLKFSKAKKKPKVAKSLATHWFFALMATAFVAIVTMFALGIAMQGEFFTTSSGSYLQTLGYYGELCVGLAMPAARFFGYAGGNPLFVSADFCTAYLVAAGMLNMLSILDTYDIAMGRKP